MRPITEDLPNAFRVSDWPGLQTRPSGLPMRRVVRVIWVQRVVVSFYHNDDSAGVIDSWWRSSDAAGMNITVASRRFVGRSRARHPRRTRTTVKHKDPC